MEDQLELVPRSVKLPKAIDSVVETRVKLAYDGNRSKAYSALLGLALDIPDPRKDVLEGLEERVAYLEGMMEKVERAFERSRVEL